MTQLVPSLIVTERTVLRRRRELAVPGTARVAVGEQVSVDTVVVRGEIPGEIVTVSPSESLGVPFDARLRAAYLVREGDAVTSGQVLVRQKHLFGLVQATVESPIDGSISFITHDYGRIGIQYPARAVERRAYLGGVVVGIEQGGAVELECVASFVQGVFGVGGERSGKIVPLSLAVDAPIEPSSIPLGCQGAILCGGSAPTIDALRVAAERGVQGMVCGSVSADVLQAFSGSEIGVAVTGDEAVPFSLIITEGFGCVPMAERTHRVLQSRAGAIASVNGATQVRAGAMRPEVIIPWPAAQQVGLNKVSVTPRAELRVGSEVRLIRYPYFGLLGVVRELPEQPVQLETGAHVRAAKIELKAISPEEGGSLVIVPRANIELV